LLVCYYNLQITTKISDRCDIRVSKIFQERYIYTVSNSTQSDFVGLLGVLVLRTYPW
jgi:hypothetical protein